jgi:hypothetical protein
MLLTVDVLKIDFLVVDVLELDVLGARHFQQLLLQMFFIKLKYFSLTKIKKAEFQIFVSCGILITKICWEGIFHLNDFFLGNGYLSQPCQKHCKFSDFVRYLFNS